MPEYSESLIELVRSLHEGSRQDMRRMEKRMQQLEEELIEIRILLAGMRHSKEEPLH
jgi:hypothetical protein